MTRATAGAPPSEVVLGDAVWRISRAWPLGADPAAGLAVEANSGRDSVRAALWRDGGLELLGVGEDPKLSELRELASAGTVVSHRLRKRAVVRLTDGSEFVKVVRAGRADGILAGIEQARPFEAGFRTPEVLGSTAATVRFSALAGRSLHEATAFTDGEWHRAWEQVGSGLVRSHGATLTLVGKALRHHEIGDEVRVLEDWYERAAPWVADPGALRLLVLGAVADLRRLGRHGWVPTHRDLHDKQLMWDPELGPGMLDVDTACLSHPALDLGNLRAHARWRVLQGLWSRDRAAVVADMVDRVADSVGVPPDEVAVFERATLARISCVYAFRPGHARTAQHLQEVLRHRVSGRQGGFCTNELY